MFIFTHEGKTKNREAGRQGGREAGRRGRRDDLLRQIWTTLL